MGAGASSSSSTLIVAAGGVALATGGPLASATATNACTSSDAESVQTAVDDIGIKGSSRASRAPPS